jgi:hypothetical protein
MTLNYYDFFYFFIYGLFNLASYEMRDNWTKIARYLVKYKQKWERAVKKSDERERGRVTMKKCNGKLLYIDCI